MGSSQHVDTPQLQFYGKITEKPWGFRVPNMLSPQTIQLSSYSIDRCYPVELSKNSQLFMNKSQHPWIFAAEL